MKAKILKGTTIDGKLVNEGDIIDIDRQTFSLFKSQGQAEEYVEPAPPTAQTKKEAREAAKEAKDAEVPHAARGRGFTRETEATADSDTKIKKG